MKLANFVQENLKMTEEIGFGRIEKEWEKVLVVGREQILKYLRGWEILLLFVLLRGVPLLLLLSYVANGDSTEVTFAMPSHFALRRALPVLFVLFRQ